MKEHPGKVVAERVYTRRHQLGLTQEALSHRSGLRQSMISQVEANRYNDITAGTLMALAKGLEVSLDYLVGLTDLETDVRAGRDEEQATISTARSRRRARVGA